MGRYHYVFPRWSNLLLPLVLVVGAVTPLYVVFVVAYGLSPQTLNVGYQPRQPVEYSHELHVGQLGIDCRYCHNTVEYAAEAAIPPTATCMGCHTQIHKDSPKVRPLRESFATGEPVNWVRVHDLPDYSYFNHSAHIVRGVSCVSCHGRVDRMEIVSTQKPLSMGWCLECHRNPAEHMRDPAQVTNLGWSFERDEHAKSMFETQDAYHDYWTQLHQIDPSQDCSTCHR